MSESFTGGNYLNNAVTVDYVKREVSFKPLGSKSMFWAYADFLANLVSVAFVRVLLPFWGVFILFSFVEGWAGASLDVGLGVLRVVLTLSTLPFIYAFSYSLFFLDGDWREREFPVHNYSFSKLMLEEKCKTVRSEDVIDGKFVLPEFANVGLLYEASGDFSFFLERVEVRSNSSSDDGSWSATFSFSEQPLEGELRIRYD